MRRCLCLLACLILACPIRANDKAKPNTLTPKEIEDGWILLFDGETHFGWKFDGKAKVENGVLTLGGSQAATATTTAGFPNNLCSYSFEARWEGTNPPRFSIPEVRRGTLTAPSKTRFSTQSYRQPRSRAHFPPADPPQPWIFEVAAGSDLFLRSVKVQHAYMKPLFTGKDLTGWKEHPGKKSKFSVTSEGWMHIQDGPGDLQTEALFDDFILQLECKTNGKHFNSGVFFRCRPGEYQQGYEAQIHNGFDADKPKEYIVEEYDPKTHELTDKKKVLSPALDYGTGGIYRRVPARKQAAKDGEWFTMTVIAQGQHIATWVNGIQLVDWTDNRPLKDNARQGCRLERGAISLQGHDPTTDLYFRNIRIAELPKK
jgi:hypothetical protein